MLTPVHNQGNHICSNVLSVDRMYDDDDGDDDYCPKRRTIAKHALLVQKGRLKIIRPKIYFSKAEQGRWPDERYESTSQ